MGVVVIHAPNTAAMGQQLGRFSAASATPSARFTPARAALWMGLVALAGCGGRLDSTVSTPTAFVGSSIESAASMSHDTPASTLAATRLASAPNETPATAVRGVLLPGVPGTNAYSALHDHVEETADATASASQRLNAVIDRNATVGQVNAAMSAVGARIVSMQPGNAELVLGLAQPAHDPAARHAVAQLLATRAFTSIHAPGSAPVPAAALAESVHAQGFDPSAPEPIDDHASPP